MNTNEMAAAGFYFINWSYVVRRAFCGVRLGRWEDGDPAFKEQQCWSPSSGIVKGLFVGNNPIRSNDQPETSSSQQQTSSSYDVCGFHMQYRPNSRSERRKYILIYLFISVLNYSSRVIFLVLKPYVLDSRIHMDGMGLCTHMIQPITHDCSFYLACFAQSKR